MVVAAAPGDRKQPGHRLDVVVQDVGTRVQHRPQRRVIALEIGDQNLDHTPAVQLSNGLDRLGEDEGAAVRQVVPVHGGDHDMLQSHLPHCLGHPPGLLPVQHRGTALADGAVAAASSADPPQDHERGHAMGPAFTQIRAHGLLADGIETQAAQKPFQFVNAFPEWSADLDPGWMAPPLSLSPRHGAIP